MKISGGVLLACVMSGCVIPGLACGVDWDRYGGPGGRQFTELSRIAPAPVPNFEWGVPNMGGPLLTASGLVVIGAAAEHALRIFDVRTGRELWFQRLPAAAAATPMSYEVDGVQYIAIVAGGHDQLGLKRGDYLLAFRLRKQ